MSNSPAPTPPMSPGRPEIAIPHGPDGDPVYPRCEICGTGWPCSVSGWMQYALALEGQLTAAERVNAHFCAVRVEVADGEGGPGWVESRCGLCSQSWPCDASVLGSALAAAEQQITTYENLITYETSCANCAGWIDHSYEQYCHLEALGSELDEEREKVAAAERRAAEVEGEHKECERVYDECVRLGLELEATLASSAAAARENERLARENAALRTVFKPRLRPLCATHGYVEAGHRCRDVDGMAWDFEKIDDLLSAALAAAPREPEE